MACNAKTVEFQLRQLTACFRWNHPADQRFARTTVLADGVKAPRSRWSGACALRAVERISTRVGASTAQRNKHAQQIRELDAAIGEVDHATPQNAALVEARSPPP